MSAERARTISPYVIKSFLVLFSKKEHTLPRAGAVPSFSGEKEAKRLLIICVRRMRAHNFPLCNQKFFGSFFQKRTPLLHART
ncbi:hypothetical protein NO263_09955 [Gluconacetobacter entanii]|uniref:Uncharacterized protein n=1 Tax=Gluconacetobacter entanii TaxID=108528 RepID=A0ABT3K6A1_9PROT|nr:hypothetical protein [Gluconacetobacter entanii]MCW4590903.1 hypothetical protein [Gluconacetobacter entanii]MCW4592526.1 hypothetical protein [Gluconacetobacter entanii]NPC87324.1 hypothetical protein [Gluconacetobacter entanii]